MRALVFGLVLTCGSTAIAQQPSYIQKREQEKVQKVEQRKREAAERAEIAKIQREYDLFVRTGILPKDKARAEMLLKGHEARMKQLELQAKLAEKAPKGKWVWRGDPFTGRVYDYFETEEETKRAEANKYRPPVRVSGTLSPWGRTEPSASTCKLALNARDTIQKVHEKSPHRSDPMRALRRLGAYLVACDYRSMFARSLCPMSSSISAKMCTSQSAPMPVIS